MIRQSSLPLGAAVFLASAFHSYSSPVTYYKDVAPLVYRSCSPCHHPGGIGPFPLLSFEDVRKHASQIVAVTKARYMPPWPPQPGYGDFKGDRHLSGGEIRLLAEWVAAGKLAGKPSDAPPAPVFPDNWQLGKPNLVLHMKEPFQLPASGSDLFRNFVVPSSLAQTRYIRGFELRINIRRAVHHANVVLDRTRSLRRRDGQDGSPGFPGMDVTTEAAADDFEPDSHFLFWKPATALALEPPERSWRLDPDTDLILNMHLQPTGKPESITADIGLYFSPEPPTEHPMLIQLERDGLIRIPPGAKRFTVTDELILPVDVDVLAIYPHAHYLGKTIEACAFLPDGERRPLVRIPDWDINWQATYEYDRPVFLPKGTRVVMRVEYDNSSDNPRNPNHPPRLVVNGDRSSDEMGHVWLQVIARSSADGEDGRWALQEAVMRRRLEKYPDDFLAEYNLGALLQSRGRLQEAVGSYRRALLRNPGSATAHNALGAALLLQDRTADAIHELQAALRADPRYDNARFNLGRALAIQGDLFAAQSAFAEFLRVHPDDAGAQSAMGTLCFRQKNYSGALAHLRTAAKLAPEDADVQANLGTVLAITGDLASAIEALETALRLNPNHAAARQNLNRARAALAAKQ